jgi:cytochrome c553
MSGMLSGMEGRTDLKTPANWKAVADKLQKSGGKQQALALEISSLFGDKEATQRAFAMLKNKSAPKDQRIKALQTLTAQQQKGLLAEIPYLIQEPTMKIDAIRSIAAFDDESLGRLILENYPKFSPSEKLEAMQTLSSRARYGNMLTKEIKAKKVAKSEVPASVARQLLRVVGSGFIEVWGPIESVPSNQAAYDKYRAILSSNTKNSVNLTMGKTVFSKSCGSCHKMYGEGEAERIYRERRTRDERLHSAEDLLTTLRRRSSKESKAAMDDQSTLTVSERKDDDTDVVVIHFNRSSTPKEEN